MRVKFPVAVHLFLMRENSILLLQRYNTGYEDGNYSVVAGHLDGNETVYDAIIREAKEEAGITIKKDNLTIVQVMHRYQQNNERIDYFFYCEEWEGSIQNSEKDKCSALEWYEIDNLPDNTIEYIRYAIENYQKGVPFTVFGW